jgi:drug/metabolite transporter, DME family
MPSSVPSLSQARATLVLAAILWSLGSLFMRLLSEPTVLALHEPRFSPLQIAFYRGLFAGLIVLPLVSRSEIRLTPRMLGMMAIFGLMSALYLSALGLGPAANAIFLQNTAPVWVYLLGVYLLGEAPDRRSWRSILVGMVGAVTIVAGNWPRGLAPEEQEAQAAILLMATGSGMAYAMVVLFLRALRAESAAWLTAINLIGGASVIGFMVLLRQGPEEWLKWVSEPTGQQLLFLVIFGGVQMAAPYWLFTRGLRTVGAQEAGLITLLEPLLNPVWAYLLTPEKETPTIWTALGGGLLLFALAWRYFPFRKRAVRMAP